MKLFIRISPFVLFILSATLNPLKAQKGPGGVGNSDGSGGQPQNIFWLLADSLSLSDTDPVATWNDISGNTNDATQGTSAAQPLYRTGEVNGLPAVVFDGTDDFMPFDGSLLVNTDFTVIFVAARRTNGANFVLAGTTESCNQNMHFGWRNTTQNTCNHWCNDIYSTLTGDGSGYVGDGNSSDDYGIFINRLASLETSPQRRVFQNGTQIGSLGNANQLSAYGGSAIARWRASPNYYSVNVAEVIFFTDPLNDAQLQIVNQYLNVKYDITIANDYFSPASPYINEIAGIGEESNGEHSEAGSGGLYLTAMSGLNSGDYIFVSHDNSPNNSSNFNTSAEITVTGAQEAYNRIWYLDTVGTPAARIAFDFDEALSDGLNPINITNYSLLYRSGTSGNFSKVKNADGLQNGNQVYFTLTDSDLKTGYYTFASEDSTNSPLEGAPGRTWYSLVSGNWNDPATWTLDPSGSLPNNPDNYTPSTSPTNTADDVVILTGRTVTVTGNNLNHQNITIEGRLDLQSTSGHGFNKINGTGRILMSADNFPSGDASHFYSAGQGEGTVEYYGGNYSLSTAREFFDVEMELTNNSDILTLLNDYTINGDLRLKRGTFKINDDASTTILNLTVQGDVEVEANGSISTGLGDTRSPYQISGTMPSSDGKYYHDIFHQFTIYGNFTNRGTVRFTNLNAPNYGSLATNGAVTVRFKGASNSNVNLYSTTDFYNLVIDKGTDKTYKVNLYSDNTSYFTLYGANSAGRTTNSPFSAEDPQVRKALWIYHGTLQLRGSIHIPSLSEGSQSGGNGDYAVGKNARIWIDGTNVTVYSTAQDVDEVPGFTSADTYTVTGINTGSGNQAMSVYGEFRISDGYFGTRNSAGFIFWSSSYGQLKIDGGTCYVAQVRSANGASGVASYTQTGGTVTVFGNEASYGGEYTGAYALFGLESSNAVFQMSGGNIILQDDDGNNTTPEFYIISSEGNYQVTGGTVSFELQNGRTAQVQSTANVYNFTLTNSSSTGNSTVQLLDEFTVSNDLTINNYFTLNADGNDLKIGDDFTLQNGGTYTHGNNTTHFIGSGTAFIRVNNTSNAGELQFNNLTINRDQRYNTSLFNRVEINSPGRSSDNHPVEIAGKLFIQRGEFDVDEWEVDVKGDIEITDGQIISSETTKPEGWIVLNGTAQQTIQGSTTTEQEFGSFELDNSNGALLASDINVTNFTLTQGIMNLDIYNLYVAEELLTAGTFSNTLMFETAGNPSDGGITRYLDLSAGTTDTEYLFPFGSGTSYTPAKVIQSATIADAGNITINPVADYHPATSDQTKTIPYYWTTDTSGFASVTYSDLKYTFTYPETFPASVNKGSNLWDVDYDWYTHNNVKNGNDIEFPYAAYLTEDFTLGNNSVFNAPTIYYSRVSSGNWSSTNSWSTVSYGGAAAGSTPGIYDIVKIGYHGSPGSYTRHRITLNTGSAASPIEIAGLILEQNPEANAVETNMSRLVIPSTRGLRINGKVSGDGEIQFQMDASNTPLLEGDFGEFVNTEGASFIMRSNNGNVTAPTNLTRFPRLSVPGASDSYLDSRSVTFTTDIYCHNLNIRYGGTLLMNNGANGDIEVRDSLRVGGIGTNNEGRIIYQNNGSARTITVGGNLIIDTDGSFDNNQLYVETGGSDNLEHSLEVNGNITLRDPNSLLDLYTANDGLQSNVILKLVGEADGEFTDANNTVPELYRIVMNKQSNDDFDFSDNFSLMGPTDSDTKALELISGRLMLTDSDIDLTLTSGGADFYIPSDATLYTGSSSTVRISGDNTGIKLDGRIHAGWDTKWYLNGGTNNYIQYTSSGNAEIDIYQAQFYVGSQIRRLAATEEGILSFQLHNSNSTVVIGTNANLGGETDKGVFELVNTGSYFSQVAGSKITIANAVSNATVPSLYLNIANSEVNLENSSTLAFGGSSTSTNQNMKIYSSVALRNIETDNTSANNPQLTLETVALTLDTLTIASGTILDANGLDLNINGNFVSNGTFTANQNNTYFLGTNGQQIFGNTTFYNLHKTTANNLSLNNDITVENELHLELGTLNDGSNTLNVYGNTWMEITHTYGGAGDGILMNGSSEQTLTGKGTFGKLSVNNTSGIALPPGSNFTVTNELQLEAGVLDIGKNLLTLEENASIVERNPFSESNMIQTNISFTDAGVKKHFPAISSSETFIYPLGSSGKYTPVEFNITGKNSGGAIRVKAADEIHPTIQNDTEPCNEIFDSANVLKYHWLVEATGISGFSATATMKFYNEDYQETSTFYDVTDYIAARLLWGSSLWDKYDPTSFDEASNLLRFTFTNTDDNGVSGDYTAGIEDQAGSCKGAIPDSVATYITISDGNWTDETIWDTYPTSGGSVPAGGPRGAAVIIEHDVTIPTNYIVGYKTQINSSGIVRVGTTFGHRLGIVEGTGTLQLERGDLPAGIYDVFFGQNGGTLEYSGNGSYDVLSEINNVKNLKFTGTGERRLPNLDFEVYGYLEIAGDNATLEVINEHDRKITLDSLVRFTQGSFDAGIGTSEVIFNGTDNQIITGNFTGSNAFLNVEMNNPAGVTLSGSIEIDGILEFKSGIISSSTTNTITVNNSSETAVTGYGSSTYVDGPLRKLILSGGNFIFPVGDNSRYGQVEVIGSNTTGSQYWEAQYYNANPHPTYDTSSYLSPLTEISGNEYWRVEGPSGGQADVRITWDNQSLLPATTNDRVNDLHIVEWIAANSRWESVGTTVTDNGVNDGTIQTSAAVNLNEHIFTIGTDETNPLPTATFTNNDTSICSGQTVTLEIELTGSPNWNVTIEEGGHSRTFTGITTSPYTFSVDSAGTYSITAVSDVNGTGAPFGPNVVVTVLAEPSTFNVTGGGNRCSDQAGVTVGLDGSESGINYTLLLDGSSVGSAVAGDGSPIDFGLRTTGGVYTVEAAEGTGTCTQTMSGSATVTVNPLPNLTLAIDASLDTICTGDNTQMTLNFTAGTAPFDFTVSDGTNTENLTGISANPYTYSPVTNPTWIDDGSPDTDYTYTVTTITDANGCTNSNLGSGNVTVFKIPVTGPQYHISNNWGL